MSDQYNSSQLSSDLSGNAGLGKLYIVATPIGNLGDMTQRAIDTLMMVDHIAVEDTRHSARLLNHFNITTPVIAYHDHSDARRQQKIVEWLLSGKSVALISDAGTPLISDPGYQLVREARAQQIPVIPVPGACALVAALSVAGLPSDRFAFEGFLPAKANARRLQLDALAYETRTLLFYESTHRIVDSLQAMVDSFGADREVVIARELTKTFETILSGNLQSVVEQVKADTNQQRGEFVVLVSGHKKPEYAIEIDIEVARIMTVLLGELPVKQASVIGAKLTGVKKRDLYQWAVQQQEQDS
jgi:16S rRNA (cytidine1402-2'-O)-methyltransferase